MTKCNPQAAFHKVFAKWGAHIGRKPYHVIGASAAIALILIATIFPRLPLNTETEVQNLWVPRGAQALDDKAAYDAVFASKNKEFRRNLVYFTTSPPGGNVLTASVLKEVRRFDLMVNDNLTASEGRRGADLTGTVGYSDVCAKSTSRFGGENSTAPNCLLFGHPLELFYRVGGVFELDKTDAEILAIVNSGKGIDASIYPPDSNRTFDVEAAYGGIVRDASGAIVSAKAITIQYLLDDAMPDTDERELATAWEDQLNVLIDSFPCDGVASHDRCSMWTTSPPLSGGSASGCNPDNGPCPAGATAIWSSDVVTVTAQTEGAISRELGATIGGDVVKINISFAVIIAYCLLVFIRCRPAFSRGLVALSGLVSCGLAIGIAYGFTTLCGVKVNPVVTVLPFILLGIGVDDMFVIINAFEATPIDKSVEERMSRAMASAGVSVTITSLTDLFAFILGVASALPALSDFCAFAAVGILADFLLQISFFAGFLALDARREAARKPDGCPCCLKPIAADLGKPMDEATTGCCCCCYNSCDAIVAPAEGRLRSLIRRFYAPLLVKPWFKALALAVLLGYAGFSGWAASNLRQDFQFRWFVNDDATLQQVFDVQDQYFGDRGVGFSVVLPPSTTFDYTSVAGQQAMLALETSVEADAKVEAGSSTLWYPLFREWIWACGETESLPWATGGACVRRDCMNEAGAQKLWPYCSFEKQMREADGTELLDGTGAEVYGPAEAKYMVDASGTTLADGAPLADAYVPPAAFLKWLDQFIADAPLGGVVSSDLVWAVNATVRSPANVSEGLAGTRLRATHVDADTAVQEIANMNAARELTAGSGIAGAFPYSFSYLYYEQYAVIEREALLNLGLALVAVCVITLIVLADLRSTTLVMLCVLLTDVDILGLMWLWGLTIDSVAIVNLVLAVGLAVDYSAHVAHAFAGATGTRDERAVKAVVEMGTAVIHGATSTFLAVLVLASSQSYIFRIFFKQFFGICVFGVAHGLVFLPIMLTLLGPEELKLSGESDSEEASNPKKSPKINVTSTVDVEVPHVDETPAAPTDAAVADEAQP